MHYLAIWVGYWKNMTFELSGQLSHRRLGWRILLKERKKEEVKNTVWKLKYTEKKFFLVFHTQTSKINDNYTIVTQEQ